MNAIASWWRSRDARSRLLLGVVVAIAVLTLVATLVWLPLDRTRTRLAMEIPRLAASIELMQRQAAEVERVRPLPSSTPASLSTLPAVLASGALTRSLPGAQATLADPRRIRLAGSDLPWGALLETLAAAQSVQGLRVESARVDALEGAGRVRAEVFLARP